MLSIKRAVIITVCVVGVTVAAYGVNYLNSVQKYKKIIKELKIGKVNLSNVSDGTYKGSCDAIIIGAKVVVSVKDHKITDIKLVEHKNERGKPAEVITGRVLKAQKLEVDTISGATNSSKVILKAIENALVSGEK